MTAKGQHGEPWATAGAEADQMLDRHAAPLLTTHGYTDLPIFYNPANAARAVACVNALDGLEPAGVSAAVAALRKIADMNPQEGLGYAPLNVASAALRAIEPEQGEACECGAEGHCEPCKGRA